MKWIKCSDEWPTEEGSYYVYNPNGFRGGEKIIYTAYIPTQGGFKTFWCPLAEQITHWMPKPDPPIEESEEVSKLTNSIREFWVKNKNASNIIILVSKRFYDKLDKESGLRSSVYIDNRGDHKVIYHAYGSGRIYPSKEDAIIIYHDMDRYDMGVKQ